jgi:hypothetical protein
MVYILPKKSLKASTGLPHLTVDGFGPRLAEGDITIS